MIATLILNDGTELEGSAKQVNGNLSVYVYQKTLAELFAILNDPEKVSKIVYKWNNGTSTFKGYKHLKSITELETQFIGATLTK